MKATDILKDEHRVIEQVIATLEAGASQLEAGKSIRPAFFRDAADFFKGFADGCHHRKEENVLFQNMAARGIPVEGGPIGVMLNEHQQGRRFIQGLREAATRLEDGDQTAAKDVLFNARGYAALLRQHIMKEDNILFPMADRVFGAPEQATVLEAFERVEHEETGEGIHEKYLALAEALQRETI